MSLAIQLQKNDQLAEADAVFSRILAAAPDHGDALHYAGVLAHQLGRGADAVALIEKSIRARSRTAPDYFNNLGIVLQEPGSASDEAIDAPIRRAIALDPTHTNAHSNLGVLLRATGRPVDAEAAYRTAIALDPSHIDAYTNLGILLNGLKRSEEAVACFCKVILLRPKHREARRLLALAHCTLGEVDEAVKIFEEWLDEEPDDPIARHMLAACTGREIPLQRASDGFVVKGHVRQFRRQLRGPSWRSCRHRAFRRLVVADAGGHRASNRQEESDGARRRLWNRPVRVAHCSVCAPADGRRSFGRHADPGEGREGRLRRSC